MSMDRTHMSRTFLVLLLIQVPLAVVTISASILSFGVHAAPSAVAIVVTILHPLLALFYSSRARGHRIHLYVTLLGLVVCTGLLCIPLAYFARRVHMVNQHLEDGTRTVPAWAKVGCATTSLSIFLDLALTVVLVYPRRQYALPESGKASFITASSDTPPQLPPLSALAQHRISFPDHPPTPSLSPNAHIPPTIMLVPESDSDSGDSDSRGSPAAIPVQPVAAAIPASNRITRSLSTKTLPPLPPLTPPQQHQPSLSPATQPTRQSQPPSDPPPYPSTPAPSPPSPSQEPSQQPPQQQIPLPSPSPIALPSTTPTPPTPPLQPQTPPARPRPTSLYTYDPSQPLNRIALLLALTSHQLGPGNWPATEPVLALLRIWATGGGAVNRGVGDINLGLGGAQQHGGNGVGSGSGSGSGSGTGGVKGIGRGVTALAHACLVDLSQRVWAAQRGGWVCSADGGGGYIVGGEGVGRGKGGMGVLRGMGRGRRRGQHQRQHQQYHQQQHQHHQNSQHLRQHSRHPHRLHPLHNQQHQHPHNQHSHNQYHDQEYNQQHQHSQYQQHTEIIQMLTRAEVASLERVGWDLGWVEGRIRRAGGWLVREGRRGREA